MKLLAASILAFIAIICFGIIAAVQEHRTETASDYTPPAFRFDYEGHCYIRFGDRRDGYVHDPDCPCITGYAPLLPETDVIGEPEEPEGCRNADAPLATNTTNGLREL